MRIERIIQYEITGANSLALFIMSVIPGIERFYIRRAQRKFKRWQNFLKEYERRHGMAGSMSDINRLLTNKMLQQKLTPEWLVDKTNIFTVLNDDDKMIVRAQFVAYWNSWIKRDLKDLFDNQ